MFINVKKLIARVAVVVIFSFVCIYPGFAGSGKKWIPIGSAVETAGGEPQLEVRESNQSQLNLSLCTGGFFVNERLGNREVFKVLQAGRYHGDLSAGYPNLPTFRRYIYIPKGKKPVVTVTKGNTVVFNDYLVYPVQKPQVDGKQIQEPGFFIDEKVYESDRTFPEKCVYLDSIQTIRGHQVALLHINSFRYNPRQRVLEVYPDIDIEINFIGQSENMDRRFSSSVHDSFVKSFVLNPVAFGEYQTFGQAENGEGTELLVIVPPSFESTAIALKNHKNMLGIDTLVKTTDETGATSGEIKTFIQNAYNNWIPAPSYVLLLGDVETIPTTYQSGEERGTDLYYSTLDGDDYVADIFLGRISVDTLEEAEVVVQKIISYESNPPTIDHFYSDVLLAAYFQDYSSDGYEDRRFVRTSEEVRDFLLTQGYHVDRVYYAESNVIPTHYNLGYYGNGEPLPPELLQQNGFAWSGDAADILTAVNDGAFLVMHRDHGMDRNSGYGHTGWGDPYFVETHIPNMVNDGLLPVILSINCQTGWFDGETDHYTTHSYESFCELLLRSPGGAAVAVIGATRNSYSGYNDFLAQGFMDCIWPEFLVEVPNNSGPMNQLGPLLNHGKIAMDIIWGDPWDLRQVEYEIFHIHGDPTLRIWTRQPGFPGTDTLRVQSTPVLGVPIQLSQTDIHDLGDGNTNFTRTYIKGTNVTLTAPVSHNGSEFIKWIKDGVDAFNPVLNLEMNVYHSVVAEYTETFTLDVQSGPVSGVGITVSPDDNCGNGSGNTAFSRQYDKNEVVTLTAPLEFVGRNFLKWQVDGLDDTNQTIQVTMDQDREVVAKYSLLPGEQLVLIIDSDANNNSAPHIKTNIEARGIFVEYTTGFPGSIDSEEYSVTYLCLGIYPDNHVLTATESDILIAYLDSGGKLFMEGGDTWAYDYWQSIHSYFGIYPVSDGTGNTDLVSGIYGTFTQGLSFSYGGENYFMDQILADGTGAFNIWENQAPLYYNAVARETELYKTIGQSFEFGGIPAGQQEIVSDKYLEFFGIAPVISVTTPASGEYFIIGDELSIQWQTSGISTGTVRIMLRRSDGSNGYVINPTAAYNSSPYSYTIPGDVEPGSYFIRIKQDAVVGESGHFNIFPEEFISITSPTGSDFVTGEPLPVAWICNGISSNVRVILRKSDGSGGYELDPATPYDSSPRTYNIPCNAGPGSYFLRVKDGEISGESNIFSVSQSLYCIAIGKPRGGENFFAGDELAIEWTTSGLTGDVRIVLRRSDGSDGYEIDPAAPYNASPYIYAIPSYLVTSQYFIRIKQGTTVIAESQEFSIVSE